MSAPTFTPIQGTSIQTPTTDPANLQRVGQQLKEAVEIGQRLRGNVGDSFVRVSELVSALGVRVVNNTIQPPATTSYLTTVDVTDSISGTGASSNPLQLVGDTASPGNNMVYGTNSSGTRGWYAASGSTSPISITDGTNTVSNVTSIKFAGTASPVVSGSTPNGIVTISGTTGAAGPPGPAVFLDVDPYQGDDGFPIPGPIGPSGVGGPGPQGVPGVATYLTGEDGNDGDPGPPGAMGPAGVGTTGAQGPHGLSVYVEDGAEGEMGMPGVGPPGPQGTAGVSGVNGVSIYVEDGPQGEDGFAIPGAVGPQGATGAPGPVSSGGAGIMLEDPPPWGDDLFCVGEFSPRSNPVFLGGITVWGVGTSTKPASAIKTSAGYALQIANTASSYAGITMSAGGGVFGTDDLFIFQNYSSGTGDSYIGTRSNTNIHLQVNGSDVLELTSGYVAVASGVSIRRLAAATGWLDGDYSSGETATTSGCIYSIGGIYTPGTTTLGTMYGVGFCYSGSPVTIFPSSLGVAVNNWCLYLAIDGTANVVISAATGNIYLPSGANIYAAGTSLLPTTGSGTATLTGCTTSPTVAYTYFIINNVMTIAFAGSCTATSNAATCTLTSMPGSVTGSGVTIGFNNGAQVICPWTLSGTVMTIYNGSWGGGFTTSGLKGIDQCGIVVYY